MIKFLLILLVLVLLGINPVLAFAQDTSTTDTTSLAATETTVTPTTKPIRAARMEAKDAMKDKVSEAREAMKSKMMEAREVFKEKMKEIKDARKAQIVEKLDGRINEMNKKRTTQMTEHLARLTTILGKVTTKAAALKAENKNTATLEADVALATTAIETAKTAVTEQAAKDYVVDFDSEATLKIDAKASIQQFITDIKTLREKVRLAQQAVAKAAKSIPILKGESTSLTPTSAVTQ